MKDILLNDALICIKDDESIDFHEVVNFLQCANFHGIELAIVEYRGRGILVDDLEF